MINPKTLCFSLAAALVLASAPALAQVYSWKDPATGQSKFSNIAPPWYSRGDTVSGPRVVATVGERVIDDTALPYEDRLRLSGKSREYVDNLRLPQQQRPATGQAQAPNREAPGTRAAKTPIGDKTANRRQSAARNGS